MEKGATQDGQAHNISLAIESFPPFFGSWFSHYLCFIPRNLMAVIKVAHHLLPRNLYFILLEDDTLEIDCKVYSR